MKSAFGILLLAMFAPALAVPAYGARPAAELKRAAGQRYVRLTDWAKDNRLDVCWLKADETLQLSNRCSKILVTADSRDAQINGVHVWLLFPAVAQGGTLALAQLDVETTLQPLLSPPRNRPGAKVRTVCLDPGHGGKDPGNEVGVYQEKRHTLLLAKAVRSELTRAGLKVTLTRTTDSFVELSARPEYARRRKADLFVSLHYNATDSNRNTARGAEVYCLTPAGASSTNARGGSGSGSSFAGNRHNEQNLYLAYEVQKALTQNLDVEDRGVRRARFAVLRDAAMPAVLVEAGFMSNPAERRQIVSAEYRRKIAHAIVVGVLAYKRSVEQGT
jgi:N-acetylmuramoyl-L-alanine amidase